MGTGTPNQLMNMGDRNVPPYGNGDRSRGFHTPNQLMNMGDRNVPPPIPAGWRPG